MQYKQKEWTEQWSFFKDTEIFLFKEWISPHKLDIFSNKNVLECGCGGGQHSNIIAQYSKQLTAVDLNTIDIAKKRNAHHNNITYVEEDIATMDLGKKYDIVISIGVVHHTDNPEKTVENMKKHLANGGLLILWVYSDEGNSLVKNWVEPIRKKYLIYKNRKQLIRLSKIITMAMYIPIYSIYMLKIKRLPYYEYFENFRKMSFYRNMLNVFDKLNAPQTDFISYASAKRFVSDLKKSKVLPYKGVSWRISGIKN